MSSCRMKNPRISRSDPIICLIFIKIFGKIASNFASLFGDEKMDFGNGIRLLETHG